MFYRLLLSTLGGILTYGILWSMSYSYPIVLTALGWLVPILAALVISMTSFGGKTLHRKSRVFHNLVAIAFGYFLALAEIFMTREIQAPALASNYYPSIRKKQGSLDYSIKIGSKHSRLEFH